MKKALSNTINTIGISIGLILFPSLALAEDSSSLTSYFTNGSAIINGFYGLLISGVGLYGFVTAARGVSGLMNKNPNESKMLPLGQLIFGAALFSLMALILAFNSEFIGGSTEATTTIEALRGSSS
jgi:hypothetical protein